MFGVKIASNNKFRAQILVEIIILLTLYIVSRLLKNRCKTNRLFWRDADGRDIKLIFSDGKLVEKMFDFI